MPTQTPLPAQPFTPLPTGTVPGGPVGTPLEPLGPQNTTATIPKTARYRLSRRLTFRGLNISIETDRGEKRHWVDPHNKTSGTTLMKYPYGYIRRTEGVDGDHVDCYIGPNERAPHVYIIHQMKAPDFKTYDEDKCMLGFLSATAAKKAYLQHYTDPRFFGSMTALPFETFKEKALKTYDTPKKIATFYKKGSYKLLRDLGLQDKDPWEKALPWLGAAGAAALGYGALRRFNPSKTSEGLRALQQATKGKRFSIATQPGAPAQQRIRSLLFGAPTINEGIKTKGVVLHHNVNPRSTGDIDINAGMLTELMHDKWYFDRLMREGVDGGPGLAGALPETKILKNVLQSIQNKPEALKKLYPEGFFIKPRLGSMNRGIVTSLEDKGLREALQNPHEFIIQPRMPIAQEFRVHTIDNEPFTATHRRIPNKTLRHLWERITGHEGGGAFVPVTGKTRSELQDFVRRATAHLKGPDGKPLSAIGESSHLAYDVARLHDGTYKLIEANPVPGTLMNPITSQKLQRAVMGKWSRPVATAGALGLAVPTGVALEQTTS